MQDLNLDQIELTDDLQLTRLRDQQVRILSPEERARAAHLPALVEWGLAAYKLADRDAWIGASLYAKPSCSDRNQLRRSSLPAAQSRASRAE